MAAYCALKNSYLLTYLLIIAEFVPTAKAECTFGVELVGYWVLFGDREREEVAIEDGEARFSTLGRFICKGKHWDEDYYKVFSVFTNGW